jgi:hypothetical protein
MTLPLGSRALVDGHTSRLIAPVQFLCVVRRLPLARSPPPSYSQRLPLSSRP